MMKPYDFYTRSTIRVDMDERKRIMREIARLGIGPSSDANAIFEAFTNRFSMTEIEHERDFPSVSDIQRIARTGAGKRFELVFVLHNLFVLNHIEAECLYVYRDAEAEPKDNFNNANLEQILLYVPAIDVHFDPTSRLTKQLKEVGDALLEDKHRLYRSGIPGGFARGYYAKRSGTAP